MRLYFLAAVVIGSIAVHAIVVHPAERNFDFQNVIAKAGGLAKKPYEAPKPIPKFLADLKYSAYQGIRFKSADSMWRDRKSRFQAMLISPGLYYTHAVKMNVVDDSGVRPIPYRKDYFTYSNHEVESRIPPDLGFAGFKLTYPLEAPHIENQFLVFAGSSYFRGVGKDNTFGLSARGIAVDTGLPSGEQFPSFVEYWLVRPDPDASDMTFYALLDGQSLTGAYRFTVTPGIETHLEIKAVLFLRKGITLLGMAPLTSMFYYGENTPRPRGEWRPQVHDSGGLLIRNGSTGEWLWRPLINPIQLQEEYFETENVRGFGLLQRQTGFYEYEDAEARYDKRPSAWVSCRGNWGKGNVVLVEIPSDKEADDNIVAFWSPKDQAPAGGSLSYSYALSFGEPGIAGEAVGEAVHTFVGDRTVNGVEQERDKKVYRLVVDFDGGALSAIPANADVQAVVTPLEGGEVIGHQVEYVKPTGRWRLSILAKSAEGKALSLRAFLKKGDQTLTETWSYRLPWDNRISGGK